MRTAPLIVVLALLADGETLLGKQGDPIPPPPGGQSPLQLSRTVVPCEARGPFAGIVRLRSAGALDPAVEARLEVTPYPEGFTVGRFAWVVLDQGGKLFEVAPKRGESPPMDHLLLVSVSGKGQNALSLVVTGLEAGVGYDIRLSLRGANQPPVTGPTTRVDAPTCYGDEKGRGP